ncbi:MAG: hypothetical protein A2487_02175 [Candidatus Raymondbacteria bacterium RifOxyC12_full_50_8]|nr:MAG: hypothetical protein A2350_12500 [Candidatus Raymondbacteria bacterium RifOxyB12_full_50_8]OGK06384.1 MAG: hypothetical protein A2487_02175 [Candidatus Raymondbacteria bacterium RifOxyC12_full_50_8]
MKPSYLFALVPFTILALILAGCADSKNPAKATQQPFFNVLVEANTKDSLLQYPIIATFGLVHYSTILKSWTIQIDNHNADSIEIEMDYEFMFYGTPFIGEFKNIPITGAKTISLNTEKGNASASIIIPPRATLKTPVSGDTLAKDSILVTWNDSVDFVMLTVWANGPGYRYEDVFNDTILTGNSFKIPADRIKDSVYSIQISIDGYNGPLPVPGSIGNINGEGNGFVWATNTTGNSADVEVFIKGGVQSMQALSKKVMNRKRECLANSLLKLMKSEE